MSAFLHGYLLGLGFIIFLGPVFFTLLKSTLQKGFWAGFFVALGIVIGDLMAIIICSFGAIPFFKNPQNQFWIGVIGSVLLLGVGLKFLISPEKKAKKDEDCEVPKKLSGANYASFFGQGFLINFINPFVFIVWIGIIGYAEAEYGFSPTMFVFLIAALLGIFSTDLTKVYFAQKIKRFLTPTFLIKLYRFFGVILIGFGLRVLYFVIFQ
ncbi:MAG: LysE family transporter [Flavobacteriales bacterium]|nr:LysE family transporter [Flavobacteriales bacterium]MCB9334538.1 LysE family transporter [Flavobacteriales bacterium]